MLARSSGEVATRAALRGPVLEPIALGVDFPDDRPAGVVPFAADVRVRWEQYDAADGGSAVWVHEPAENEEGFYRLTSNGTAVHRSPEAALKSATYELIERDAFMAWWYGLSKADRVEVPASSLVGGYYLSHAEGWDYDVLVLQSRPGYVVAMTVVYIGDRDAPQGVVVGASAGTALDGVMGPALRAFDECVQAIDVMRLNAAVSAGAVAGALGVYFTSPHRAVLIQEHVARSLQQQVSKILETPVTLFTRVTQSVEAGYWFARVVSPQTLPFALPGKGARRNHPSLRDATIYIADGLQPEEHPLG